MNKQCILYWCLTIFLVVTSSIRADDTNDFAAYRKKHLSALQNDFKKVLNEHPNNQELKLFCTRLNLIDEVTNLLISRYQSTRSSSLQNLLDDIDGLPRVNANIQAAKSNYLSAFEVLAEYQSAFAQGLPKPNLPEKELKTLLDYYSASAQVAGNFIADRGRLVAAINPQDNIDILQLCLVMPFLHIADSNWAKSKINDLPDWMKTSENLVQLENFSLRVCRTHTAYQFMLFQLEENKSGIQVPSYSDYLLTAATSLINAREYHAGIYCLKSGIALAEESKNEELGITLRFQLAELRCSIGHNGLAVEEMREILNRYPRSDSCSKAAMLYLKYLYESQQYEKILQIASTYQSDPRCEQYLPQILYVSWVTYRHEDRTDEADKIQKIFLEKYSNLILAADMYFASAMSALASSNYDEASRLLELIEYRYPDSRVMKKTEEIRKRLALITPQNKLPSKDN